MRRLLLILAFTISAIGQVWNSPSALSNFNQLPSQGLVGKWIFAAPNYLVNPSAYTASPWNQYRVAVSGSPALIKETATNGVHAITQAVKIYRQVTFSVEMKRYATRKRVYLLSNSTWAIFDLETGSIVAKSSAGVEARIVALTGDWYRCWWSVYFWSYNITATAELQFAPDSGVDGSTQSYAGNVDEGFYVRNIFYGETPTPVAQKFLSDDLQQIINQNGGTNLVMGSSTANNTNDPDRRYMRMTFNGTSSQVTSIPAKGTDWTTINCSPLRCDAVDSAGGSYVNGRPLAGATEYNLGTAGGYSGDMLALYRYSRVLSPAEHMAVIRDLQQTIRSVWLGEWVARPVITFVFDDGLESVLTTAKPVFDARTGTSASMAIITDQIGQAGYLSLAQLSTMVSAGWSIASHTKTHLDMTAGGSTPAVIDADLVASNAQFVAWGFGIPKFLAYPFGHTSDAARTVVSKYFIRGFIASGSVGVTYIPPLAITYDLARMAADDPLQQATQKAQIDTVKAQNVWQVYMVHDVGADDATNLGTLIDYAVANGVAVLSLDQAWAYMQSPIVSIH
jgi:peptidoglycan/xylan/chitin deacetylase (PgdA/CDA1 family)